MTHRHTIGEGPVGAKGKTKIHSRAKQMYLFWGLVPLGRPEPHRPSDNNYQIKTGANVGDAILSTITLGVVQWRTIRILVHDEEKVNPNKEAAQALKIGDNVAFKEMGSSTLMEGTIIGITGNKAIVRCKEGEQTISKEVNLMKLTKIETGE
jgi:ribosomal protein L35AE/L33A